MGYKIRQARNYKILFECDVPANMGRDAALSHAVQRAVSSDVDLTGADLRRANLRFAKLVGAKLSYADLGEADLSYADLTSSSLAFTDLTGANLQNARLTGARATEARLQRANLSGADLAGTNLTGAHLRYGDLSGANLHHAHLCDAHLTGAKGSEFAIARTRILPDGDLIGWKKCRNQVLVKLRIPADARRSHAFGRKCRAEFVDVLEVIGAEFGVSNHDSEVRYVVGSRVKADKFSDDWQRECSHGIYFFITRLEAEHYVL